MTAIIVLGMHRSGTSCLANMLVTARVASAGPAIRNWDNARGHHEMLALVRLNEAVLAHSGGHYLAAPGRVTWAAAHAAERDRLLATPVDGLPPLLKDPRTLLVLPFWRASPIPFRAIGIVRHPIAVARSLASWREMPLADGVALWLAHNQRLLADREAHATPVIDFDGPEDVVIAELAALVACDPAALAAGYDAQLVHHDDRDAPTLPALAEALAVHRALGGQDARRATQFPRHELAAFHRFLPADRPAAIAAAREAIERARDRAAVLVPIVTALLRVQAHDEARDLIELAGPLDDGLRELLRAKVLLGAGDPVAALPLLEAACAVPEPLYQTRHLLPHALRGAGRRAEARTALEQLAAATLYPHGPLSTLAEWSFLDGDREGALRDMARAIEAAPHHRRGRLRARRAEWLRDAGDIAGARAELERALAEDPGYPRTRELLAALTR